MSLKNEKGSFSIGALEQSDILSSKLCLCCLYGGIILHGIMLHVYNLE